MNLTAPKRLGPPSRALAFTMLAMAAAMAAPCAHAEAGRRMCIVEYNIDSNGPVNGRFTNISAGLVSKVVKGATGTCTAKLNWMNAEIRAKGIRAIIAHAGVDSSGLNWSRASIRGPWSYSLWACESFSDRFRAQRGDMCPSMTTNHIYSYGTDYGIFPARLKWYHI